MAQISVANYFNNKKRPNVDDGKLNNAKKVLLLEDGESIKPAVPLYLESCIGSKDGIGKIRVVESTKTPKKIRKAVTPRSKKMKPLVNQGNIPEMFNNIMGKKIEKICPLTKNDAITKPENLVNIECSIPTSKFNGDILGPADDIICTLTNNDGIVKPKNSVNIECSISIPMCNGNISALTDNSSTLVIPQTSVTSFMEQNNAMDKVNSKNSEPSLSEIKQKLSRSSRLAELKASLARFQQSEKKLEVAKQRTQMTKDALVLKNFKTLEFEINLSPQKLKSPEKPYLSPKKDVQAARKNLFGAASPVKREISSPIKHSLTLPYKYRCLAEIFRSIDTVCQILYNRKETITFKKLKPAVEEIVKRNLTEKHLAQIIHLYPGSFILRREKLRQFGTGSRNAQWELVIVPLIELGEQLTPEVLLERRRQLFTLLIEKLKVYHQEFLRTLDPPMEVDPTKITRWHPLFDIEQVPDIEVANMPSLPKEEIMTTGHEVLEKARVMFHCNTRMELALERLQESTKDTAPIPTLPETSILKGIPKALLEKVRQKQAAKALESMTRSTAKDNEVQLYTNLPEIARLTRNLFVAEKKSVLPLESVIDKLCNSYRTFLNKNEMEAYLRTIAKEINGWIIFHEIRGEVYVKLSKNSDLSVIMNKLQKLAELKNA